MISNNLRKTFVAFIRITTKLFTCSLLTLFIISITVANDSTPVSSILSGGASYHLRSIGLHGIVKEVEILPPIPPVSVDALCAPVYDSYKFILEDETGSIEVDVLGACNRSRLGIPVSEGDRISVRATIHAFIPDGSDRLTVRAMAHEIRVIKENH